MKIKLAVADDFQGGALDIIKNRLLMAEKHDKLNISSGDFVLFIVSRGTLTIN